MYRKNWCFSLVVLFTSAISMYACASDTIVNYDARVSIINLIATPDVYAGKKIRTVGVASIGYEANAIYLTAEDANIGNFANGIALGFANFEISEERKQSLDKRHVHVQGVFIPNDPNSPLHWQGIIKDISFIYVFEDVEVEE